MAFNISPNYTSDDFPRPWSLETKIEVFRDRTFGWHLDVADEMINGHFVGTVGCIGIKNAGYATLQVLLSYFEMYAKYRDGYTKEDKSFHYFKQGVMSVWPEFKDISELDHYISWLYKHARNGLYHNGAIGSRIVLSGEVPSSFGFGKERLVVNPHYLVVSIKSHFRHYVRHLKMPTYHDLREKFERRFDTDIKD